jgi:hypothetical protein
MAVVIAAVPAPHLAAGACAEPETSKGHVHVCTDAPPFVDADNLSVTAHGRRLERLCRRLGMGPNAHAAWARKSSYPVFCIAGFLAGTAVLVSFGFGVFVIGSPNHLEVQIPAVAAMAVVGVFFATFWRFGPREKYPFWLVALSGVFTALVLYLTIPPFVRAERDIPFQNRALYTVVFGVAVFANTLVTVTGYSVVDPAMA